MLSSPQVALSGDEPRERLMAISNLIWCVPPRSVGVTADTVFRLPTNFRAPMQGWQLLASMPVSNLLRLGRGAVIPLDHRVGEPVDVMVNGRVVARGEVVVVEDDNSRFGVSLTEVVGPPSGMDGR